MRHEPSKRAAPAAHRTRTRTPARAFQRPHALAAERT